MHTVADDPGRSLLRRIPFRLVGGRNPLILVPVQVDGMGPYQFILDTGASHCLLSPELAEILGVRPEIEEQAMGAGGAVTLAFAQVASLAVGSTRRSNLQVAITGELRRIEEAIGCRVDGDLGFSLLKDFSLTIDYEARTLCFASLSETGNGSPSAHSTPFKLAAEHKPLILAQVVVNDQGPFQFAVDTGASKTMLSSELAAKLAIEITEVGPATGGGGQIKIFAGRANSLAVGNAVVRDHAIGVGEFLTMLSASIGAPLDGIVGYNFLNQFRVTIDYPRSVLELVPATVQ